MILISLLVFITPAFPFSDQTTTERILKENKYFIEFLNVGLTNLAKAKIEKVDQKFFDIYQTHFNAQVSYLQSNYKNSFYNIRNSQKKQVDLCVELINNIYLEDAKNILDKLAPMIIRSKNQRARLYLTLAYRDRSICRNFETIADASNPKLYSYKVAQYIEGIKFARRAKRYGFLALYESQDVEMKKAVFNHLLEIEREGGNIFYNRFLNKADENFYKELVLEYKDEPDKVEPGKKEEKKPEAAKPGEGVKAGEKDKAKAKEKEEQFEKKLEKRVRFRKEKLTATFLMNGEFDRAEEVIREYVKDFNFKLIQATFEVLAARKKGGDDKVDYNTYVIHHYDNYARIPKKKKEAGEVRKDEKGNVIPAEKKYDSLLDELSEKVKVTGDIKREDVEEPGKEKGKEEADAGKSGGKGDKKDDRKDLKKEEDKTKK